MQPSFSTFRNKVRPYTRIQNSTYIEHCFFRFAERRKRLLVSVGIPTKNPIEFSRNSNVPKGIRAAFAR